MVVGKRILTAESLFMTALYNEFVDKRNVSFTSPYSGRIIPLDLTDYNDKFICQKDVFLCAAKEVILSIKFNKRLGRCLFGGEGLFFAKLQGSGDVYIQSLPFSRLARGVLSRVTVANRKKSEGSIL